MVDVEEELQGEILLLVLEELEVREEMVEQDIPVLMIQLKKQEVGEVQVVMELLLTQGEQVMVV
jgi:hypothetical protein